MDRRLILAGLAAVTASPVMGQQAPVAPIPVTPQPAQTQTNPSLGTNVQEREQRTRGGGAPADTRSQARQSGGAGASTAGQQQSEADARAIQDMLAAGTVSLQTSIFARDKAQDAAVKRFAGFEEEEQNTLADVLRSMASPTATASTGATQAASTAPTLSPEASAVLERLSRAQAGPEFDRAYVAAQIEGHQALLGIQERYLQSAQQDPDLAAVTRLAMGRAREHLAELQALQGRVGR